MSDLPENSQQDGSSYICEPMSEFQRLMRKYSRGVYNHNITIHTARTQEIIAMVPDGGNYKDLPKELWDTRKVHIGRGSIARDQVSLLIVGITITFIINSIECRQSENLHASKASLTPLFF